MPSKERSSWFRSHYYDAVRQIIEFFTGDKLSLTDTKVGDIGCGDGVLDLGLAHQARPSHLVGFDLAPTDTSLLAEVAAAEGVSETFPPCLEFRVADADHLPCEDNYFDYLISWSAFEHVEDPTALAHEMRRVVSDNGVIFVQVWPFFNSEHGSHLWEWFPEGFVQLRSQYQTCHEVVRANPSDDPSWAEYLLTLLPSLNRITVDDLQRALIAGGFTLGKVELLTNAFHVPPGLSHLPLSTLGISGVKLLASAR